MKFTSCRFRGTPFFSSVCIGLGFGMLWIGELNASPGRFQEVYDYYFPLKPGSLEGGYREWFDRTVFNPDGRNGLRKSDRALFEAVRGDALAFHTFMHSDSRDEDGEFEETWNAECLLLLLCLGDQRFADLLAHEDRKTKAIVADALVSISVKNRYTFPKTVAVISRPKSR